MVCWLNEGTQEPSLSNSLIWKVWKLRFRRIVTLRSRLSQLSVMPLLSLSLNSVWILYHRRGSKLHLLIKPVKLRIKKNHSIRGLLLFDLVLIYSASNIWRRIFVCLFVAFYVFSGLIILISFYLFTWGSEHSPNWFLLLLHHYSFLNVISQIVHKGFQCALIYETVHTKSPPTHTFLCSVKSV